MSILSQPSLFSWKIVDRSPEIFRLGRILDALPDEALVAALRQARKGRRDDYPVEAVWRSFVAGVVLGHPTVAALIRELKRNGELREVCGFDPLRGDQAVPPEWVYSRLGSALERHWALVEAMFDCLVDRVASLLPDFGRTLAMDSKALPVLGAHPKDADTGVKRYESSDGSVYEKIQTWFGYKLHLLVDARYELPVAFEVTAASVADSPRLMPIVERLKKDHPPLYERAETLAADKGYDDGQDKLDLYEEHGIAPVIPARDCHTRTGRPYRPLDTARHDTIYVGPTGQVCCKVDPFQPEADKAFAAMQYMGFESDRQTLKFRCPAAARGVECRNRAACKCALDVREGAFGRVVRVPLHTDPRLFTAIYRHSRTFRKAYKKRTAVERVNSRLDNVHGLERSYCRSRGRMAVRAGLALIIMLATAAAWVEAGQTENVRRLLRAA